MLSFFLESFFFSHRFWNWKMKFKSWNLLNYILNGRRKNVNRVPASNVLHNFYVSLVFRCIRSRVWLLVCNFRNEYSNFDHLLVIRRTLRLWSPPHTLCSEPRICWNVCLFCGPATPSSFLFFPNFFFSL